MAGSGAAFTRANSALAKALAFTKNYNPATAGADGASQIGSYDAAGGALWITMAGFITALLGGEVAHPLPARARMVANKVPSTVTTIITGGFATAGDGGGATYVRATGPFTDGSSFQSADGAWWQFSSVVINPQQFGAVGDGVTDDTTALQNAINYAKNTGCALNLYAKSYLHTKSLDWGKPAPFDGKSLKIIGSSVQYTKIIANLTENYPANDFTNQIGGTVERVMFTSTAGSQHTALMLFAETTGTGMNQFCLSDCSVQDLGNLSKFAVFGWTADQFMFEKCNVSTFGSVALAAAYFSINNPAGITSKFHAIASSNADVTVFQAHYTAFLCGTGPGLWTQAYSNVNLFSVYTGVIGTGGHAQGMFRFGGSLLGGSARITCITAIGCRTEDNGQHTAAPLASATGSIAPGTDGATSILTVPASSGFAVGQLLAGSGVAAGTTILANLTTTTWQVSQVQTVAATTISSSYLASPAVYVEDYVNESYFQGAFNCYAGAFGGPGSHINSEIKALLSYGAFNNAGPLIGGKFHFSGGSSYGGSFDQANSYQYTMGGRIGATYGAILTAYGDSASAFEGLSIDVGSPYRQQKLLSGASRLFYGDRTVNSPTNFRIKPSGEAGNTNVTAYTGGSGLQQFVSIAFNPAYLFDDSASANGLNAPNADTVIMGGFNSAWAAGGEMKFTVSQVVAGVTKNATLVDLTSIPAFGAASGWRCTIKLMGTNGGLYAFTVLETFGTAPVSVATNFNLGSQGFSAGAGANLTVAGLISNAGSSPVATNVMYTVG